MMKENNTELEQNIDEIIKSRKISNIFTLETARLIKAELVNNKHSKKPVSELEVLQKNKWNKFIRLCWFSRISGPTITTSF